jgi:AcrR family transcriptional regulator
MGRPVRHAPTAILECAKRVSAEVGPRNLTIAAVAERAGAPVGSIYHRYASRDEILATVWLDLVEAFQARFLAELGADDPIEAGLAAVRYTCRWVRRRPREARLMLLHHRDDFAAERWPLSYRRRAQALAAAAAESLQGYAARLLGRRRPADLRSVRFALVDLPAAGLKRDIESGVPPSASLEALLLDTCVYALRRAGGHAHVGSVPAASPRDRRHR